jgi:hypothetical protein
MFASAKCTSASSRGICRHGTSGFASGRYAKMSDRNRSKVRPSRIARPTSSMASTGSPTFRPTLRPTMLRPTGPKEGARGLGRAFDRGGGGFPPESVDGRSSISAAGTFAGGVSAHTFVGRSRDRQSAFSRARSIAVTSPALTAIGMTAVRNPFSVKVSR